MQGLRAERPERTASASAGTSRTRPSRSPASRDAKSTFQDDVDTCKEQRAARKDVCDLLGNGPYEPAFDPNDFDTNFAGLTHPNPFFPLDVGSEWTFASGDEIDHVAITSKTKLIDGVTCLVSHDEVTTAGQLTEKTDDWFAQAKNGDTWYCGEDTAQYETFPGDDPQEPELVGIEGAFKAGRDGDLPGIVVLASPTVGAAQRQEFSLNNAEDNAEVLSTTYAFGQSADLDTHVPQALAELLVRGRLSGDPRVLRARARRRRAEVLRPGDRRLPRDRGRDGDRHAARRLQRGSALRDAAGAVAR